MHTLLLISPVARQSLMGSDFYFRLPAFNLLKVAALTPPDWQVVMVDEKVEPLDLNHGADLVGLTAMTPTVNRAYEIADHFRRRGIAVVMGGMHASQMPDEALGHCDSVVIGEAEGLWPRVLKDFQSKNLQPVYRHENGLPTLEQLPLPNWELCRGKKYLPVHFVETTRGCPLDCEFCSVTNAFGGRYRNRPLAEVEGEIRSHVPFKGTFMIQRAVFFVDDNIIGNRAYARQFLERIADYKLNWFGQASVAIARDPEILKLCRRSGCTGIFIGLETLSPNTLVEIGKLVNKPHEYLDIIRRIQDHGIGIDASFVFGFDSDDEDVFDRTLEFVIKAKIEIAYFSILTPYPGTRLHRKLVAENRIINHNWADYDSSNVVFRPKNFSPEQLQEGYERALRGLFSISSICKRLWGTQAMRGFFYPMNFGFRQSTYKMLRKSAQRLR